MSSPMQQMDANRSALSGVDMAARFGQNPMDPEKTTVREYLERMGIQVDGPMSQLLDWAKKQTALKQPGNKPAAQPQTPNPPGRPPVASTGPSGGNLQSLMRDVRQ